MNRHELARNIRQVSKLSGAFTLRSGKVSDTYFDKYLFESDPKLLRSIAEEMQSLIPVETEVLCGLELGGIPVVTVLSQLCGLPAAFIRKEAKKYGTCKFAEGPALNDKQILLVEDVVSSGGAIVDYATMLRESDVVVTRAICVIDRRPSGSSVLEDAGIALDSVFTFDEIDHS